MQAISLENRRVCVAPMMDWTDRHCRYFHRLLTPASVLYTEMVTSAAVLHGNRDRLLAFDSAEHPLALQLGGSDPDELARCAKIAQGYNFDEVNLNVGCPSGRVQKGRFGACLMREPDRVAACVAAMRDSVDIPVTVKTRLGVDELDSFEYFSDFVHRVAETGCTVFAVHARKAWLSGLSPKQNRELPPLRHDWVYRLKRENPGLTIILNGGVSTLDQVRFHLGHVDGVMLGRSAYHDPWILAECSRLPGLASGVQDRLAAVREMGRYASRQVEQGVPVKHISRHLLGLFQGQPGARVWRRFISEHAHCDDGNNRLFAQALNQLTLSINRRRAAA